MLCLSSRCSLCDGICEREAVFKTSRNRLDLTWQQNRTEQNRTETRFRPCTCSIIAMAVSVSVAMVVTVLLVIASVPQMSSAIRSVRFHSMVQASRPAAQCSESSHQLLSHSCKRSACNWPLAGSVASMCMHSAHTCAMAHASRSNTRLPAWPQPAASSSPTRVSRRSSPCRGVRVAVVGVCGHGRMAWGRIHTGRCPCQRIVVVSSMQSVSSCTQPFVRTVMIVET